MSGRRGRGSLAAIVAIGLLAFGVPSCATLSDGGELGVPAVIEDAGGLLDRLAGGADSTSDADAAGETASPSIDYYTVDGPADLTDATIPEPGAIAYGTPDALRRPTRAIGTITKTLRDNETDRDRDMPDDICGWPDHNPKVSIDLGDGDTYHGYLFNRSHLIAKSLGGRDIPENLITGTRTQNVGRNQPPGGMAYTETLARDWLDAHPDGTIVYMATPRVHRRRAAAPHRERRHRIQRRDDRPARHRIQHGQRVQHRLHARGSALTASRVIHAPAERFACGTPNRPRPTHYGDVRMHETPPHDDAILDWRTSAVDSWTRVRMASESHSVLWSTIVAEPVTGPGIM